MIIFFAALATGIWVLFTVGFWGPSMRPLVWDPQLQRSVWR